MQSPATQLTREIGLAGATMMGLGAILGTGVFVSIGIAAGIAGPAVVLATALAAALAVCNGLSSAQLAANHSISGGTYEYGYRYLNSGLGFTAGWMFLLAKSASAATAALGFAGYLLHALGYSQQYLVPLGLAAVVLLTLTVLSGMRRTTMINSFIVLITLFALLMFVALGAPAVSSENFTPFFAQGLGETDTSGRLALLFQASALMFVAYTGYGRIATLGEEVHNPKRTIPKAIITTMLVTMILYISVATVGIGVVGAEALQNATDTQAAPLAVAAQQFNISALAELMVIGAITAMLGVLLNLVLGLSRVLLAMGRRRDMPAVFGLLNKSATTPTWATLGVGAAIAGLVLIGDIKTTWSFSAFTVLIYYAITNLAALRLPREQRLYPRWIALLGMLSCLFLAFWVDWQTWLTGLGLIAAGLAWHWLMLRRRRAG